MKKGYSFIQNRTPNSTRYWLLLILLSSGLLFSWQSNALDQARKYTFGLANTIISNINNAVVNAAPVIIASPEAQTITAGKTFSFHTGTFSDPDAGDELTYTATLSDGKALPAWLQFNAATQTFSGTAPSTAGLSVIRITATDKLQASISASFSINVEKEAPVVACSPLSALPCSDIGVSLPYMLIFNSSEGGLADKNGAKIGFTMVDAPSARLAADGTPTNPAVPGYEPGRLTLDPSGSGKLTITTSPGIAFLRNGSTSTTTSATNSQLNALGVGVEASQQDIEIETTLLQPAAGTNKSEQAGLWFGLNEDNFVKIVAVSSTYGRNNFEFRREVNGLSSNTSAADKIITATPVVLSKSIVKLKLIVKRGATATSNGTIEGRYTVDGNTEVSMGTFELPASFITGKQVGGKNLSFAGIFASHRLATTPVNYSFDDFSIKALNNPATKTLTFLPNALDFTAVQGGTVTAKSTVLSANQDQPGVRFTPTTASWLTLPSAALGTVTFNSNNISSTMSPGLYEAKVVATADGYEPAVLTINLNVTSPAVAQEIKVNFQDATTVPPTGWVRDYGQPFGLKTGPYQDGNLEYGWRKRSDGTELDLSVPGNGRNRNPSLSKPIDVLQATVMHMQANDIASSFTGTKTEGYWEVKVANGQYDVTVSAGDALPSTTVPPVPEIHSLNVEGVSAISGFIPSGTKGSATRFKSNKVRVTVTDGYLTINADGGTNTKINSVHILPVDTKPYLLWSTSSHNLVIEKGTTTSKTFSLDLSNSGTQENLPVSLSATYNAGASNWLSFNATHNNSEPNVIFDYTAAKNLPEGTYSATILASAAGYSSASTTVQVSVVASGSNQPYVISSTPANGATNVSVNTSSIAANNLYVPEVAGFKGGVDNSTLNASSVKVLKVTGSVTSEIQGVIQGTGGGDAISFSPTYALEPNTTYRFVITSAVKSYSGAAFIPYQATFTTGSVSTPNGSNSIEFAKQTIPGTTGKKYTSLTFGPDGRFYALRLDGVIERFNVNRETGMLSGLVEITSLVVKRGARSAVGLTFDPSSTASNLIAWVSHCSAGLTNAPEFDGNLSRLSGPDLGSEELVVTKLPRSQKDHLVNNIVFGPDKALYFCQGSNSSMGRYDGTWQRDESLLAGSVLRLDLTKLTGITLPLDVRTTANLSVINSAPANNIRMSDGTYNPYAINSPLTIYASGVRNAYDLLWHSNGQLYVPTNGSAAGGNSPASVTGTRRPDGTFYNGPAIPATSSIQVQPDWLFRVNPLKPVGFFGHPNPLRGEYVAHRGYVDNPKYPSTIVPDANYRGAAFDFELNKSPNGVIEYKSNNFGGALKGRILVCRFSGGSDIIVLEPGSMVKDPSVNSATANDKIYDIVKSQTGSGTNGITGLGGFVNPLDLTEDVQTGNLYVIEYNWNNTSGKTAQITLLKATAVSAQTGIATVSPTEIIDNDVVGGAAGQNHTITVANTGNSTLQVTGLVLDGVDKSQFQLVGAPTPTTASPVVIAPNSAVTFNVAFNPTSTGVKTAKIVVTSNNNAVKEVTLKGLGTTGLSGTNEPSLQAVLDVHGIKVNVGDDNKSTNIIHSTNFKAPLLGEEVAAQQFIRAEDGPVTIKPLSVFGPQHTGGIVTAFGWYNSGNANAKNELFSVANSSYQTVDVQTTGNLSFDPGSVSFGFYSRWPYFENRHLYSEDALNTFTGAIPHHVRIYPLKNADGTLVENAYIIATEEHVSGYDYQDIVVAVYNVKPANQVVAKKLTFSGESLAFSLTTGTPTPAQTITLTASTGTPTVVLTQSEGSQWLTIPNAGLGTLSFNVQDANLSPGTYTATVTASAEGYSTTAFTVSLEVKSTGGTPKPSNAAMIVENLNKFPANDRLTFSLIQTPWRRTSPTITPYNQNHDSVTVRISNRGSGALSVNNLVLSNTSAWKIAAVNNEPYNAATKLPITIAPGGSVEATIQFVAKLSSGRIKIFNDTLSILSNDDLEPKKKFVLHGLWQYKGEGANEPYLQEIVNAFGFKTNVGIGKTDGNEGTKIIANSDEIFSQYFVRADATKPAYAIQMAAYHGCCASVETLQWFAQGATTHTNILRHRALDGQTLLPYKESATIVQAEASFSPTTPFGFKVSSSYSDLSRNGEGRIGIRVYKAIDPKGNIIPNAYIVAHDYINNPGVTNYDYQDNVYFVSNIKPAEGPAYYSELAAAPSAYDFGSGRVGTTTTQAINLSNLGKVYATGSDPAVTIKSLEISGINASDFTVSGLTTSTLAAQAGATVNVSFRPTSQGIKNAALLVHYNNSTSPLRIPLYGTGDNDCAAITVVKRIKGGADAVVTINGKQWEADKAYRQGSVQLDKPAVTPIAGTEDDVLYQTYLSASANLAETRYQIPLANGNYMIRLHFVENYFTTGGSRVFSIAVEGETRLANLDIFREVGYKAALVKDFEVTLTDGQLNLKFNPTANRVALAGLEIFAVSGSQSTLVLNQNTITGASCNANNGSITLSATNTTSTDLLYKLGMNGTYQASPVFNNLAAGTYTFYAKENKAGGCETSKAFVIPAQENNLSFTLTAPVISCEANTGTATIGNITGGSGNYTITWNTTPAQTGTTATNLTPGVYTVTITDASGCSKTQNFTVTRNQNCNVTADAIRINAGGTAFTTSDNRTFMADAYYGGVDRIATPSTAAIANTEEDVLYQNYRSATNFNYSIPVQNGTMNVVLHFAEVYFTASGKRMFNVDIEGARKLTDYDIFVKAGGALKAVQETFQVTVTDGVLNIDFTSGKVNMPALAAIEVIPANTTPVNQAPVLATIGNKTTTVNQTISFTASATDADANQIKAYSLVNAPTGAVINASTGMFTWTPTQAGTYTFTVVVTDNGSPALSDEELITITVNGQTPELNVAPVLAVIGNKTGTVNQAITFTASATDANPNQTLAYSLVNAPSGAAINASTGAFTWTPATAGTFNFTVKVTDNGSPALSDEKPVTVTVSNVPVTADAIRINAGGAAFTTSDNRTFMADAYYGGVDRIATPSTAAIANTEEDVLYQNYRSATNFNYSIPVQNGTMNVVLHFAEVYFTASGKRMFNVDIEGARKLTNYDIFVKAGGALKAVQETFQVTVTDGVLNIDFTSGKVNMPALAAIEVIPQVVNGSTSTGNDLSSEGSNLSAYNKATVNLYPNPNPGDQVNIDLTSFNSKEDITLSVRDLQGRLIQVKTVTADADGSYKVSLAFSNQLAQGEYIIIATSKTKQVSAKLLVR
ncbi:choice-of-anchor D domain-containing protein [Adhaeribacter swui]|uniref:Choice-of-anchor D domain-containing protein n=1 Tax=Adhaeribacter swui TaxID=2086471 RepID=A0A7G7G5F5_9BACT|nr:malectin domain-containing carbohydrate-binding protein [Adhaeribacter swui]QNF32389.1 choice-of-anchor D domain-containing protein [Adhaeribacter swui]